MESYKQGSGISAALYAMRLYTRALRCKIVYEERKVRSLFVKEINEPICDNLQVNLGQHSRALLTEWAHYADSLIKTADRNVGTSRLSRYKMTQSAVKPSKSFAHAVMSSDVTNQKSTSDVLL